MARGGEWAALKLPSWAPNLAASQQEVSGVMDAGKFSGSAQRVPEVTWSRDMRLMLAKGILVDKSRKFFKFPEHGMWDGPDFVEELRYIEQFVFDAIQELLTTPEAYRRCIAAGDELWRALILDTGIRSGSLNREALAVPADAKLDNGYKLWMDLEQEPVESIRSLFLEEAGVEYESSCETPAGLRRRFMLHHLAIFYKLSRNPQSQKLNQSFFVTHTGRLDAGPLDMREGDEIVVLYGGRLPLAVRRLEDGNREFLGACYVHGIMHGVALTEDAQERTFVLV